MTINDILLVLILIMMAGALYWIGGIFYTVRKASNELIKGVMELDRRLAALEAAVKAQNNNPK